MLKSKLVKGIDRIQFVTFDAFDVVRHPVVADIIKAYGHKLPRWYGRSVGDGHESSIRNFKPEVGS